jgi:phosphoribosylformylglycinamidine synthase
MADGINCDKETKYAFGLVGGNADIIHINSLKKEYDPILNRKISLDEYHILAIPGGFSYGDYVSAGKILSQEIMHSLDKTFERFIQDGKLIIGICNGFQVLVKCGYLPHFNHELSYKQSVTLTNNDNERFEDRWVTLLSPANICVWTKDIQKIELPVAHGEGKFIASEEIIQKLFANNQVVFQYADAHKTPTLEFPANPNGSLAAIAGICDSTGRIFGLMPHPERYNNPKNHYLASLQDIISREYIDQQNHLVTERKKLAGKKQASGLLIFKKGIDYVVNNLL